MKSLMCLLRTCCSVDSTNRSPGPAVPGSRVASWLPRQGVVGMDPGQRAITFLRVGWQEGVTPFVSLLDNGEQVLNAGR